MIAQDIMDKLEVDHEVSVSDHLNSMEWNEKYRAYQIGLKMLENCTLCGFWRHFGGIF